MTSNTGKILVVDDDKGVRTLLKRYLESAGYECRLADGVATAKDFLNNSHYDLVLCDLEMPGETGLDLIKYVTAHYPKTGKVMVTAHSSQEIVRDILDVGVYGYLIKPLSLDTVLITVDNALRHLSLDLYLQDHLDEVKAKMMVRTEKLDAIMNNLNVGVIMVGPDMKVLQINKRMEEFFPEFVNDTSLTFQDIILNKDDKPKDNCPMIKTFLLGVSAEGEKHILTQKGKRHFRIATSPVFNKQGDIYAGIGLFDDVTEKKLMERELHQAQKLEAVGQLAAGIAHEINSPVQYVGDNIRFLQDAFEGFQTVLKQYKKAWGELKANQAIPDEMDTALHEAIEDADLDFLLEEVPATVDQSLDGVRRVDGIVRAMKDFSHPGTEEKTGTDINRTLESTITVCRNEWKYVTEMELELAGNLPEVPCFPGDISQAFLNIIVNGAHAISDMTNNGSNGMGKIFVKTAELDDCVQITIRDTGGGIPQEIQDRVFEPFFTTKERGKGTGQGLAIAYSTVVGKHDGKLLFDSVAGQGTTFTIELPLA